MKIWHLGAASSPQKICGVNQTVWLIAREQARQGHQVTLLLGAKPHPRALDSAKTDGINLMQMSANCWRYTSLPSQLDRNPPDLVHLHSVFIPKQATLARTLGRYNIPYIITPHGGLNFQRSPLKKRIYSALLEKARFSQAAAITVLTPQEEAAVRAFVPQYQGVLRWMPNPIDLQKIPEPKWQGNTSTKQLVYLGRFDVLHKGIDRMVALARELEEFTFHLYGTPESKTQNRLARLQQKLPNNVHFHDPIYDAGKTQVLANASLYVQTSRWEGFPISIAEAMALGVPAALSEHLGVAQIFARHDLGLPLSVNPLEAATQLRKLFENPEKIHHWSRRARSFACEYFQPQTIADGYLDLYQTVLNP
ncbi:glycosyltransferase family 4 protein [Oscillatoriales cyanobacterium LEGE 11467]|uniref:Glycosyltransferase family 4 protein n=1 Tax=Zarconia navalis LEGE 11467 TaxID=1828826 RepID=A0A928Z8Y2_9CYAN|nr:glycosyltransferase family 4 protein [Zarconia navalis]MBE9041109.1 glycosyltransferase family 4 protein [Zarconia navalis LEGE 11467]